MIHYKSITGLCLSAFTCDLSLFSANRILAAFSNLKNEKQTHQVIIYKQTLPNLFLIFSGVSGDGWGTTAALCTAFLILSKQSAKFSCCDRVKSDLNTRKPSFVNFVLFYKYTINSAVVDLNKHGVLFQEDAFWFLRWSTWRILNENARLL